MRNLTPIVKHLLIINVLAYLATVVFERMGIDFQSLFGLHFFYAQQFAPWQLITYMFMHANLTHLFFNMFALWMFGCTVESAWGPKRFLWFYMLCGIGAGVIQELAQFGHLLILLEDMAPGASWAIKSNIIANSSSVLNAWTTVGASGAVYGVLLGFGLSFPEQRIFIFPIPVPIKGKWFVCIYAAVELFSAIGTTNDGVAHLAHLGGMLIGYIIIRYWRRKYNAGYGMGWDAYEISSKPSLWQRFKNWFAGLTTKRPTPKRGTTSGNPDWDYNQKEKEKEDEMDKILEKISRSGYQSLSEAEKRKLFDRK